MKPLPEGERWRIVHHWQERGSIRATARALGLRPAVVLRWVSRYRATGGVAEQQRSGRPRALSTDAAKKAKELLLTNTYSGAKGVAHALHSQGITAKQPSPATVLRAAKEQARLEGHRIQCKRGRPAKQLNDRTKEMRLAFAQEHANRCWDNVMFTDRKKFLFCYPGAKVGVMRWGRRGDRMEAAKASKPMAVNLYAGLTLRGVTACHMVAGTSKHKCPFLNMKGKPARNITKGEYKVVLRKTLLPGGQRLLCGRGVGGWVLQQDNDPTHSVAPEVVKQHNKAFGTHIAVLGKWPPHSPDLNPIENLWAWVQARVNARGCKTFDEFKAAVLKELGSVPQAHITGLYKSMPTRMALVIKRGGDKTGY